MVPFDDDVDDDDELEPLVEPLEVLLLPELLLLLLEEPPERPPLLPFKTLPAKARLKSESSSTIKFVTLMEVVVS